MLKLVTWLTRMNKHGLGLKSMALSYLRKITRAGQIQDVYILVDVLAIEPSKNEYPAICQKRHMISPR